MTRVKTKQGTWTTMWHRVSKTWSYKAPSGGVQTGFATEAAAAAAMTRHAEKLAEIRGARLVAGRLV